MLYNILYTYSGSKKRLRILGNGIIKRPHSGKQHSAQSKNSKRIMRLRKNKIVHNDVHMRTMQAFPYKHKSIRKRMKYISKHIKTQHSNSDINNNNKKHKYNMSNIPLHNIVIEIPVRDKLLDLKQ